VWVDLACIPRVACARSECAILDVDDGLGDDRSTPVPRRVPARVAVQGGREGLSRWLSRGTPYPPTKAEADVMRLTEECGIDVDVLNAYSRRDPMS